MKAWWVLFVGGVAYADVTLPQGTDRETLKSDWSPTCIDAFRKARRQFLRSSRHHNLDLEIDESTIEASHNWQSIDMCGIGTYDYQAYVSTSRDEHHEFDDDKANNPDPGYRTTGITRQGTLLHALWIKNGRRGKITVHGETHKPSVDAFLKAFRPAILLCLDGK